MTTRTSSARLICADVLDGLRSLDAESVQTCITSPPYWNLRDYNTAGQIGLEPTPSAYVERMVEVFREVRRVLRPDGTLWVNIGDSYAGGGHGGGGSFAKDGIRCALPGTSQHESIRLGGAAVPAGLKPKDLVGIPWRLAFALQDDGWYLRSDIIWHKPNPMPESVRDRPTKAHEYLFLLSKQPRYFYDADAIREPAKSDAPMKMPDGWDTGDGAHGSFHRNGREKGKQRGHERTHDGFNARWDGMTKAEQQATGANKRSVWTVATQGFAGAHFATFPEALIEPCVLAGSRVGDTVLDCFVGSGTTGVVALRHGRTFVGIDLNPEYIELARKRIHGDAPLLNSVELAGIA